MGMFLNYHNISDNYIPNNLIKAFPYNAVSSKLNPIDISKPYEEYNSTGDLIGYFWRYGETLNLEFNIDGEITVESDALLFSVSGQIPTESTLGYIGQRAYNFIDLKSWTCIGINNTTYYWQPDIEFTYPSESTKSIYVSAEDYLKDKKAKITLYNFRMEPIYENIRNASPVIVFNINRELSEKLVKGIYYCSLSIFNDSTYQTIFDSQDCSLLVK